MSYNIVIPNFISVFRKSYSVCCVIGNKFPCFFFFEYIGNIMGAYRTKEIVPKSFYGKGKMYKFLNKKKEKTGFFDPVLRK